MKRDKWFGFHLVPFCGYVGCVKEVVLYGMVCDYHANKLWEARQAKKNQEVRNRGERFPLGIGEGSQEVTP